MTDTNAAIVQTPEPTLRDDLRNAVESLKDKPEHAGDAGKIADAERRRDDAGRFTPKEPTPAAVTTEAKDVKRSVLALPDKIDPAAPIVPKHKPPEGWTAPMKEKFAKLDEDVQAEITRRESESHKRISANDDERTFGKQMREIAQPYAATLAAENTNLPEAFKSFLNTAYILRTGTQAQKIMALQTVAQQFNVPLGASLQQAPASDPRIETLAQQVARIERERQADTQARQAQEQAALTAEIEAFKASSGHDHFDQLKPRMGVLLEKGLAKDLQDAYDQACWSDPVIRSTLAAQTQSEAEQKRVADQKAKTDAAKRAAVSVTGSPGGTSPVQKVNGSDNTPLRDTIREAVRAATGRV